MASNNTRRAVAAAADAFSQRPASRPFDETLGAKDWRRLRAELVAEAASAGEDWRAAVNYVGNIAPAAVYNDALVLDNSDAGAPPPELKHTRQAALLGWIRRALPPGSDSLKLIAAWR